MIEYICSTDDKCGCCDAYEQAERIVRCRDCKYCEIADWANYILYEHRGSEIKHLCHSFEDYEGTPAIVEPDGFCAWGERKVVE